MAFYSYLGYGTYSKLRCTVPGILLDISALIHRWQAITVVFMQDGAFELFVLKCQSPKFKVLKYSVWFIGNPVY